eukprot:3847073-Ditylum_brightwellii.AAC.1
MSLMLGWWLTQSPMWFWWNWSLLCTGRGNVGMRIGILEVWNGRKKLSGIVNMRTRVGMRMILLVFNYNDNNGGGVGVHGGDGMD